MKLIIIKRMEKSIMPYWLEDNGRYIQRKIKKYQKKNFYECWKKNKLN